MSERDTPAGQERLGTLQRPTPTVMSARDDSDLDKHRLRAAIRLVLRRYARQVRVRPGLAIISLILPGLGNIFVHYVPPLAIAWLLSILSRDTHAPTSELVMPVLLLGGAWLVGEAIWRLAGWLLSRFEVRGIRALYAGCRNLRERHGRSRVSGRDDRARRPLVARAQSRVARTAALPRLSGLTDMPQDSLGRR